MQPSRTQTTRLRQTILPVDRRLSLRCGSHTLTRGRNKPAHQKTNTTTHRLLLRHVHPHRKKLRHLRTRLTSRHQSPDTLATPPCGYKRPSNHTHGPCKPHLLENTANHQQKSSQMVHGTPRLQPHHKTRTWKGTCSRRHAIQTTRSRQRRRRQYGRHAPPRTHIRQTGRRTRPQVDVHRRESSTRTTKTTTTHERMARSLSTRVCQISYGTIHTPLETRRQDGIPTERRTQTRPSTPDTRQTHSSTHRTRLDHLHCQKSRLVARHVQMD